MAVKARLRAFLKQMNQQQVVTMVLTSHDLGDIEALCSRIALLDRGRVVFGGSIQALKGRFSPLRSVHVALREAPAQTEAELQREILAAGPCSLRLEGYRLSVQFDPTSVSAWALIARLLRRGAGEPLSIGTMPDD